MTPAPALSPALSALRGEHHPRPAVDTRAAAPLRVRLEAATRGLPPASGPIVLSSGAVRGSSSSGPAGTGALRGALVNQALRLLAVGARPQAPAALWRAWRTNEGPSPLALASDQLGPDERARLESDVTAHVATLRRVLGPVPASWAPRTLVRAHQRVGRSVVLRDVVDLMVGTTAGDAAAVSLLDVTTSPLDEGSERVARFHALVQTLRTAAVPRRSAVLSTATGELWCVDVDGDLLERAVSELLDTLTRSTLELAA